MTLADPTASMGGSPVLVNRRKRAFEIGLRSYVGLVYLFLYLPVATVILFSFNKSDIVLVWRGFSLRWYSAALADIGFQNGVKNSLEVAFLTVAVSIVLGPLLAIGLSTMSGWLQLVVGVTMVMTLTMPEVLVGLSALLYFTSLGVTLGIQTIVITHSVFGLSLVALLVRARLAALGPSYEEASGDLGAGPFRTLTRITLPLLSPAILAGGLLAFTFSFDNFLIAFFTSGPGSQTLPIRIWGQIRFGVSPIANAIGSLIVVLGLTFAMLAVALYKRRSRRIGGSMGLIENVAVDTALEGSGNVR